jgi:hypothetical protein
VLRKARETRLLAARAAFLASEEFKALFRDHPGHPLAQACHEMYQRVLLDGSLAGNLPQEDAAAEAALDDLARRDPAYDRAGAAFVEALARELVARGLWPAEMDPGPVSMDAMASRPFEDSVANGQPAGGGVPVYGLKELPPQPPGPPPDGYEWVLDDEGAEDGQVESAPQEAGPAGT